MFGSGEVRFTVSSAADDGGMEFTIRAFAVGSYYILGHDYNSLD
jgi:hypothetical protein